MTLVDIKKRDGRVATFKKGKITKAIFKAAYKVSNLDIEVSDNLVAEIIAKLHESETDISDPVGMGKLIDEIAAIMDEYDVEEIAEESISNLIEMLLIADQLADEVVDRLLILNVEIPDVELVQDMVEKTLIENGHAKTAKQYILHRAERSKRREMNSSLMKIYEEITFADAADSNVKRENANIDSDSAMGTMLKYGSEGAKTFNLLNVIDEEYAEAHKQGDIHIHDLDFLGLTETCCQINLEKLFKDGFNTGHGYLREPSEIRSYAALACIAIQSNQNDQHKLVYA